MAYKSSSNSRLNFKEVEKNVNVWFKIIYGKSNASVVFISWNSYRLLVFKNEIF